MSDAPADREEAVDVVPRVERVERRACRDDRQRYRCRRNENDDLGCCKIALRGHVMIISCGGADG